MTRWLQLVVFGLVAELARAQCPNNYFYVAPLQSCVSFNTGGSTSLFADAEAACQKAGGHLASIHNVFENSLVASYAQARITTKKFFIGLSRKTQQTQDWGWTDASIYDYRAWSNGTTPAGNGLCAVVDVTTQQWEDVDCTQEYDYACSVKFGCPDGWQLFNYTNTCYYKGNGGNFQDSQKYCQGVRNGNLASIHSIEEQNFISSLVWSRCGTGPHGQKLGETLLGGIYNKGQGVQWTDGTPEDFTYGWCEHTGAHGSTVVMAAHQRGSGCGACHDSSWFISNEPPTNNGHNYEAFVCKTDPYGH
ncbi:unnamed protein product, partial [Mesorhabditis spiculigera]